MSNAIKYLYKQNNKWCGIQGISYPGPEMATPSGSFCPLAASVSRCVEGSPDEECCLDWDCPSKIHLTLSNIHLTHAHTHISKDAKALDENQLYNIFSGLSLTCQKIRKIRFPIKEPHPNLYLKSPCSGPPATRATPGPSIAVRSARPW